MATSYHNAIERLYVAYFNRPADAAGLNYWQTALEAHNGNTAAVSAAFAASAEYQASYAGLSAGATVARVYQNLFGRPAEAAGRDYWASLLGSGKLGIDSIVEQIADGARGSDRTAFDNKTAAALAFTNALDTRAEALGYARPDTSLAAKAFLSNIDSDASLARVLAPDALAAAVRQVLAREAVLDVHGGAAGADHSLLFDPGRSFTALAEARGLALQLLHVRAAANGQGPLDESPFNGVIFQFNGQLIEVSSAAINAATDYEQLLAAFQVRLAELPATAGLRAMMGDHFAVIDTLGSAQYGRTILIAGGANDQLAMGEGTGWTTRGLYGSGYYANAALADGRALALGSAKVVLDDIVEGGKVVVGSAYAGGLLEGIANLNVEVGRSSTVQEIASTNHALNTLNIKNAAATPGTAPGNLDFSANDVARINASGFQGKLAMEVHLTPLSVLKYGNATGNFYYQSGSGADTIHLVRDATAGVDTFNHVGIWSGDGGDTVSLAGPGDSYIDLGAGDDTLILSSTGVGDSRLFAGSGNDRIVLGTAAGADRDSSSNDLIYLDLNGFGKMTVLNFTAGDGAGADELQLWTMSGGRRPIFNGATLPTFWDGVTVQRETADNDTAAEIAALYLKSTAVYSGAYIAYDAANVGKVYALGLGYLTGGTIELTVTLVGSIDLVGTPWDTLTGANFA